MFPKQTKQNRIKKTDNSANEETSALLQNVHGSSARKVFVSGVSICLKVWLAENAN
jgi:hypothetical protein